MAPIDPLESVRVHHMTAPITRARVNDDDVTQEKRGYRLRLRLSETPDDAWEKRFFHELRENHNKHVPTGATLKMSQLEFFTIDEDVEHALTEVDQRIERANTWYFQVHVPASHREREDARAAAVADEKKLETVRSRLRGK